MRIGVPREIKEGERRVALLPPEVAALVTEGHAVFVEHGAGSGVNVRDDEYRAAGASSCNGADAWDSELVVKVKEMLEGDLGRAKAGQAIFGFQQLPRFLLQLLSRSRRLRAFLDGTAIAS